MSFDRLISKIIDLKNPAVMGLDPVLDFIPGYIKDEAFGERGKTADGAADALLMFNRALIDAVYDIVPAVKPQAAFYERFGWQGMRALRETILYAQSKGMFVIADAKRGDIGSTAEAYADAWLGDTDIEGTGFTAFGADALTVNAYIGTDCIMPFVKICEKHDKGVFVLVKTSNPSSGDLQDAVMGGARVYEAMASLCQRWGEKLCGGYGYSGVGAVVGATYPEQLTELRKKFPGIFFLVPGYGAQGGGGADVAGAFGKDGIGAVVNSSRSLMCAWKKAPGMSLAEATRAEAVKMREDITGKR